MADRFAKTNIRNVGSFKDPVIAQTSTIIDRATSLQVEKELNEICDTLYIPMAYGVKIPATITTRIYYDVTADSFAIDPEYSDQSNIISDISALYDGTLCVGLLLVFDAQAQVTTSEKPLVFAENSSSGSAFSIGTRGESGEWGNDYTCVLYMYDYNGNGVDLSGSGGVDGLSIIVTTLLHSSIDGYDAPSTAYEYPTIENSQQTIYSNRVVVTHTVYSNGGTIERSSKTRFKADMYTLDGTFLGNTVISEWPTSFVTGQRDSTISPLMHNAYYYLYYQIDCEQGPDTLEWMPLTIIKTLTKWEIDPHVERT